MHPPKAASSLGRQNDTVSVGTPTTQSRIRMGSTDVVTDTALRSNTADGCDATYTESCASMEEVEVALPDRDVLDDRNDLSFRILDVLIRDNYLRQAQCSATMQTVLLNLDNPFAGSAARKGTSLVNAIARHVRRISAVFL